MHDHHRVCASQRFSGTSTGGTRTSRGLEQSAVGYCAAPAPISRTYRETPYLATVEEEGKLRSGPGVLCEAHPGDLALVVCWVKAFQQEALRISLSDEEALSWSQARIDNGQVYFWVLPDGVPVSLIATTLPISRIISIAPVYTPPELRGHGYASRSVAALSQHLLDSGWQRCSLFTDLSNPTANSIYQQVGYRPVCDFHQYDFRSVLIREECVLLNGSDMKGQTCMKIQPHDRFIFHIAPCSHWEQARNQKEYRAETLESEGFIHCSTIHQVLPVADAFFRGRKALVLLLIDSSKVLAPLVYEAGVPFGGTSVGETSERYPHLYGPLNREAVLSVYDLLPDAHDRFALPQEVLDLYEKDQ